MSTAVRLVCVWAHGWAYSLDFFKPLLTQLHKEWPEGTQQCLMLGLEQGYFDRPAGLYAWSGTRWSNTPWCNTFQEAPPSADALTRQPNRWIGIGHSLGLHQLIHADLPIEALISLHGFSRFCAHAPGQTGTPRRLVERMLKKWGESPELVLKDFLSRAEGQVCTATPSFNTEHLQAHLEAMMNLSINAPTPVALSVLSSLDGIVSPALSRDCLYSPLEHDSMTPHSGPLTAPQVYTPCLIQAFEALMQAPGQPA